MRTQLKLFIACCILLAAPAAKAQTDLDAIMMGKGQLCIGPMYTATAVGQIIGKEH